MNLVLTIDQGIPLPSGDPIEKHRETLLAMKAGESFFIEGTILGDMWPLLHYSDSIGVSLMASQLDEDTVYLEQGVRVWRLNPSVDVTPEKPAKKTRTAKAKPEPVILPARYWKMAMEDGGEPVSWSSSLPLEEQGVGADSLGRVIEITEEEFGVLKAKPVAPAVLFLRNKASGDCRKILSGGITASKLKTLLEDSDRITADEFEAWEAENEL